MGLVLFLWSRPSVKNAGLSSGEKNAKQIPDPADERGVFFTAVVPKRADAEGSHHYNFAFPRLNAKLSV
jgi:hypothetical protein